jgi:hypothetical protein
MSIKRQTFLISDIDFTFFKKAVQWWRKNGNTDKSQKNVLADMVEDYRQKYPDIEKEKITEKD